LATHLTVLGGGALETEATLNPSINIYTLQPKDVPSLWRINEEGLPGVGKVTEAALADLISLAELPLGAFDGDALVGFVLCLVPGTRYASPNYAWFNEHYESFLYVDRVAVSQTHRNRQVGTQLYASVIEHANKHLSPIAAEVSLKPANPGSMRFHGRHGFSEVGTLHHKDQSVAMLLRDSR
jgi:predicted GNAT superfamily acetyltransferase